MRFDGLVFVVAVLAVCSGLACASSADEGSHWATARPLPEPLQEIHAAELAGQIYVAGGFDATDQASTSAYRFDPATDRWEPIADLPAPRHHMPLIAVNDTVYAIGGLGPQGPVSTLWLYDRARDRWAERAPQLRTRGASAAAAIGSNLIVVGGFDDTRSLVAPVSIYDPGTDSWRDGAPLPTPRDHLGAAVVNGLLFAIGGRPLDPGRNFDVVEAYDVADDRWTTRVPMPSRRGGLAVVAWGGRIYTYGGETRSAVFDNHEVYDPADDTWAELPALPTPRHGLAAAAVGGKIFIIGGGPQAGLAQTDVVEVFTP